MASYARETAGAPRRQATTREGRVGVVVATALDPESALALRRGAVLARTLDARLRVIHVAPTNVDAEGTKARLTRWAARAAGVVVPARSVTVVEGDVATALLRAAGSNGVDLLVLGGRATPESPSPGRVVRAVARHATTPILVTAPCRNARAIVAATDLSDPAFPVLREAALLASGTAAEVAVVHNLAADLRCGVDQPARRSGLYAVLRKLRNLRAVVHELDSLTMALVTSEANHAGAIMTVARSHDADVVAVGVRAMRGTTLDALLDGESRSILCVPLDAAPPSGHLN